MSDITRRGFLKGAAVAPLVLKPLAAIGQQGPRAESFDIVVAGAGHNSLVTAAYLAKAGYRCVVLEGRPTIGGGVKTAELTLRGFQDDVCSTAQYFIQSNPMLRNNEIPLRDYGLEYIDPDPIFHMAFLDGSHLTQWRDVERTIAEFAKFSKKDAAAYRRMYEEFNSVAPIFREATFTPIGFGPSLP
ncbi:MAG TPA: NAD(P)-binding protein, partial [Terriglobales bacterium]